MIRGLVFSVIPRLATRLIQINRPIAIRAFADFPRFANNNTSAPSSTPSAAAPLRLRAGAMRNEIEACNKDPQALRELLSRTYLMRRSRPHVPSITAVFNEIKQVRTSARFAFFLTERLALLFSDRTIFTSL